MRTVRQCHRWPREVVQSPSLEMFKCRLIQNLSNMVWSPRWPCCEQEIGLETPQDPFQEKLPYDTENFCLVMSSIIYSVLLPLSYIHAPWISFDLIVTLKKKTDSAFPLKIPEILVESTEETCNIYHSLPWHKMKNEELPVFSCEESEYSA